MILIKLLTIIFLPLFLLKDIFVSKRKLVKKIGLGLSTLLVFGLLWKSAFDTIYNLGKISFFEAGITDELTKVPVSGPSMLPTIKDGTEIELHSPKKYLLERGDIVSFKSEQTGGLHYLKRLIGLPGEEVVIKNGLVLINNKVLQEDYTLNNLPTFGNSFLMDCEKKTIDDDAYLVLGDNRTVSHDSRVIGFVKEEDIDGVIKPEQRPQFVDQIPEKTFDISINPQEFLRDLNQKRQEEGLLPLATHSFLNQIAAAHAEQVASNLDNWKKETEGLEELLTRQGYRYNLVHQFVTFGYLTSQNVVEQIFDSPSEKQKFLTAEFTEVGIGVSEAQNKECAFPVISVILSWPATPTYAQDLSAFWSEQKTKTTQTLTALQTFVNSPRVDQQKLRELINSVAEASTIASRIDSKIKNQQPLDQQDYLDMDRYRSLAGQINASLKELFGE